MLTIVRSLALGGGPHEGTYTVNPKHMKVRRLRNISDEELATQSAEFEHQLSEPTVMAYYIQRIRLAEICRHIADTFWDIEQVTAGDVRRIDSEFDEIFEDFPAFLRLENDDEQAEQLDRTQPYILLQRYILNLKTHAKRCKFHLPLLLRASHDDRYTFSRDACLRAARAIIRLRRKLSEEPGALFVANARLCGILHLYFYATMVLVMDLCVNKTAGGEETRKAEIQEACKTLEEAKQQSGAAGISPAWLLCGGSS